MAINAGIVGLPNVGKSTIFSAITSVAAEVQNYPFCTIDPNVGLVEVPDQRLDYIAEMYHPQKTIPTLFEFVDIAGLVKGASKGEGLGNRFLSHIRETGIITHVVRCFKDENISHVEGALNPLNDIEVINTELAIADLETVQKRIQRIESDKRKNDPTLKRIISLLEPLLHRIEEALNNGIAIRSLELTKDEKHLLHDLHLISIKPLIYICNVDENDVLTGNEMSAQVKKIAESEHCSCLTVCGTLEAEIAKLDKSERGEFLKDIGLEQSALDSLIQNTYYSLGLRTFYTAGEKEVRAWTFKEGTLAPQVAGIIHSDFEKGFIRAETFHYSDLIEYKSEPALRAAGKIRTEGKGYKVQDGDILHFRFNV